MSDKEVREKLAEKYDENKEFSRGRDTANSGKILGDVMNENSFFLEGFVSGMFSRHK